MRQKPLVLCPVDFSESCCGAVMVGTPAVEILAPARMSASAPDSRAHELQ